MGADRAHQEPRPARDDGESRKLVHILDAFDPGSTRRLSLGADKGYDDTGFVAELRRMCVTPHIAAKAKRSAIDARTMRHEGQEVSRKKRNLIEEPFGWGEVVGLIRKTMLRGIERVGAPFTLNMAACNLSRLPRLVAA